MAGQPAHLPTAGRLDRTEGRHSAGSEPNPPAEGRHSAGSEPNPPADIPWARSFPLGGFTEDEGYEGQTDQAHSKQ